MSEPIPESIPTSADPRSHRPIKKARHLPPSASATANQANAIDTLFLDPERPVNLPDASNPTSSSSLAPPPEIVANVQGSSAGAGSGEFHVYKASRRREYERMRLMDQEAKIEEDTEKWERGERERRERDEEKTKKNREKRNKRKKGKGGKNKEGSAEVETTNGDEKEKKELEVKMPQRTDGGDDGAATGSVDGVAATVKENGITIHDDD